jgi:hypothetical protein
MNTPLERPTTIAPDTRAYLVLLAAYSPLLLVYFILWLRRGSIPFSVTVIALALVVLGVLLLRNRTVTLHDHEVVQGGSPFSRRIAYHDIKRIHHIFVSSRYGSSPCLAISAGSKSKEIVLPMRSFSLNKRVHLVQLLKTRAPQAVVDPTVPT